MILSDRSLREQLAAGRIVIEPLDESLIQPSSIDVRISNLFRVFRNHTAGVIDVKQDLRGMTELVEIPDDGVFMLHPGEFVLGSTLERIAVPEDLVARIEGKALWVHTEVPTPHGWTTIGDLGVGDEVFGADGRPTRVKDVTEVMLGRPCFEVEFSDLTTVVADAAHLWWTSTKHERRRDEPGALRTTANLVGSLRVRNEWNHQVPLAEPVHYPAKALPIDPYVFGYWLGDGTSSAAEITTADAEVIDEIRACGEPVAALRQPMKYGVGGTGRTRDAVTGRDRRNESMSSRLRDLGVLGNKHIPVDYLEGSCDQRSALLAGLMDSDGHCDEYGRCEFVSTKFVLADQVRELVASLGFRPAFSKGTAMLNGIECGPEYLVTFTPNRPVFRLRRKLPRAQRERFERFRTIRCVRPVESVPVRCIEVASSDGMYLVTRSFIPTHNSSLGRLGLLIHSTAGFIDAGFDGHVTLELANVASLPITLYPGMKIGQVSFMQMTTPAERPYGKGASGSKYQGQRGPTPSRYFENFAVDDAPEDADGG